MNFDLYIRTNKTVAVNLYDEGVPFTPDGNWILYLKAKRSKKDTDAERVFEKLTGTGLTHVGTTAQLDIVVNDTDGLTGGSLFYDIKGQHQTTGEVKLLAAGKIRLIDDVGRYAAQVGTIYASNPPVSVTPTGPAINAADPATPEFADEFGFWDVVGGTLKKITYGSLVFLFQNRFVSWNEPSTLGPAGRQQAAANLGFPVYANLAAANAAIGEIGVPFFNIATDRYENTTATS